MPKISFGLLIRNESIFDITVDNEIMGHISFGGQILSEKLILVYNGLQNTGHLVGGGLTLEQRLSRPEAELIAKTYDKFYFDKLIITIRGGNDFRQIVKPQSLIIGRDKHAVPVREVRLVRAFPAVSTDEKLVF